MKRLLKPNISTLCILLLGNLIARQSYAAPIPIIPGPFPYVTAPGVTLAGAVVDNISGWADAMVPVFSPMSHMIWYLDPQGLYAGASQASGSLGTGFRYLSDNAGIFGLYVFGDYNHSINNNEFWFISPGIERLGEDLDVSVNVYIPVSQKREMSGPAVFASQIGDTEFLQFSGHSAFDSLIAPFESTGLGLDGQVGYRLPFLDNNTKFYVGGYYFNPKDNESIKGGAVRLEAPVSDHVSVWVSDAYDNVFKNTFRVGASIALWGRSTHYHTHQIEERMVDPIQRNQIASQGDSETSQYIAEGEGVIANHVLLFNALSKLTRSDIWFFEPGGQVVTPPPTLNDCTFERPCSTVDVNTIFFAGINAIDPNAMMYLATGTYNSINGSLVLNNGQSMWGRMADFKQPANGANRPLLIGSLDLFGRNTLDSLIIANDPTNPQTAGVILENNAQNNLIHNVLVGNTGSDPGGAFQEGLLINNNTSSTVSASEIDSFINTAVQGAAILSTGTNNNTTVENSALNAVGNADNAFVIGIFQNGPVNDNNLWTIDQNAIVAFATGQAVVAIDIEAFDDSSTWNLTNNTLSATASGGDFENAAAIANFVRNPANPSHWTLNNNTLIAQALGSFGRVIGISSSALSTANDNGAFWQLTNNTITASTSDVNTGTNVYGVMEVNGNHDTWTLFGNTIQVTTLDDSAAAVGIFDEGSVQNTWQITQSNTITATIVAANAHAFDIEATGTRQEQWTISNNILNASAAQADSWAIGISDDNTSGISSSQGLWTISQNTVTTSTGGINSFAAGSVLTGSSSTYHFSNNTINSTVTGDSSHAFGITIGSFDSAITSTDDNMTINASGTNSDAYGVAANDPFPLTTFATDNAISVQSTISATSAASNAYGAFDPDAAANSNTWGVLITDITATAPLIECKTFFNGTCTN